MYDNTLLKESHKNGAAIQHYDPHINKWKDVYGAPRWFENIKYRIKPSEDKIMTAEEWDALPKHAKTSPLSEQVGYEEKYNCWCNRRPYDTDTTAYKIQKQCKTIEDLLLDKNRKYGDSAINPIRTFSKASNIEQINVRIDDKISRIASSQDDDTEDAELDLIGYLILKRIAKNAQ